MEALTEVQKLTIRVHELEKRMFDMEEPESCSECDADAVDYKENGDMMISGVCNKCHNNL